MRAGAIEAIVIGTSAGALEALSVVLPALPATFALPVFVVVHVPPDKKSVLRLVSRLAKPEQLIFIGVIDPINPVVETSSQVRDWVVEAAFFIPEKQLGTTDDCGFAPFGDDVSTSRETAFAKITARRPTLSW